MHLGIGTKKRVNHWARAFPFELNGMFTSTHLNVVPLDSYNTLLGMDWLFTHRTKVNCYENSIEFLVDDGDKRILQGNMIPTLVRIVTSMQENHNYRKGCVLFAMHVSINKGEDVDDNEFF